MYYGLGSLVVLLLICFLYQRLFHRQKKRAREVVMTALLTALTVIGNLLSFSVLPLQMGTGLVIITGISFGPEAGFLVGSLARLLCNFFQGQGPWTPWEMFAWGLLGAIAGYTFHKVDIEAMHSRHFSVVVGPMVCVGAAEVVAYLSYLLFPLEGETTFLGWRLYVFGLLGLLAGMILLKKRLPVDEITITVFTFFTVFLIYGGIMNLCAFFTGAGYVGRTLSWESLRLLYVSGAPYDFWHALRASVAVFLLGPALIRKLERVKIKYGFYRF